MTAEEHAAFVLQAQKLRATEIALADSITRERETRLRAEIAETAICALYVATANRDFAMAQLAAEQLQEVAKQVITRLRAAHKGSPP